jgi:hypothetical protein
MDLYALRHYPFTRPADTLVRAALARYVPVSPLRHTESRLYFVADTAFLDRQMQALALFPPFVRKHLIAPYLPWLSYAQPLDSTGRTVALPLGRQDDDRHDALYDFLGKQNIQLLLDQLSAPSGDPFASTGDYRYFLAGHRTIDGQALLEIAFYPHRPRPGTFTGYLYLTSGDDPALVQARYTRSAPDAHEPVRDILWEQTFFLSEGKTLPLRKETLFALGSPTQAGLLVRRSASCSDTLVPETLVDRQAPAFFRTARQTRAFRNLQTVARLGMTDRLTLGGSDGLVEWGPVTQSISYNAMEGLRLRAGANTTLRLHPHFTAGGYLAFGARDRQLKYRADLLYSLLPKEHDLWEFPHRLLSLSLARDLNIPGQDVLDNRRDAFYNSFTRSQPTNMSMHHTLLLTYNHELSGPLAFRLGGRYLSDQPRGDIRYPTLVSTELQFSVRYAPREIFLQNRADRLYLRRAGIEWNFRHRIGLKQVFRSAHRYHITDLSARKRIALPARTGYADLRLTAGKVWNPLPFPLLFIPKGNQSYLYDGDDYNRMQNYEFVTDQFVGGQLDFNLHLSPLRLLTTAPIHTTFGLKALYGPLSERNRPALHPALEPFPAAVRALGDTPYVEMHIGLANIFNLFRVEWVQRTTYGAQGALLFGFAF